jgi:hypothetical protein
MAKIPMPDIASNSLPSELSSREDLARVERDLANIRDGLALLGIKPCSSCGKFFRTNDASNLFDCGGIVCFRCIPEWWSRKCPELSVSARAPIERSLVRWMISQHAAKIFRNSDNLPPEAGDYRFIASCPQCQGSGDFAGKRCSSCNDGNVWVIVKK